MTGYKPSYGLNQTLKTVLDAKGRASVRSARATDTKPAAIKEN